MNPRMRRLLTTLVGLTASQAVSCSIADNNGAATTHTTPVSKVVAKTGIDYRGWTEVAEHHISLAQLTLCRAAPNAAYFGPHWQPVVRLYGNSQACETMKSTQRRSFSVGSTIVKEKWTNELAAVPLGYAAMIKREPGYDVEHGDWEYLYEEFDRPSSIIRGRIESCIACHENVATRDFVFGDYLQNEKRSF